MSGEAMTKEATRKVVVNDCYGGFGLSPEAVEAYLARKGKQVWWFINERNPDGLIDFYTKVPTDDPGSAFIAYSHTSPEPDEDSYFTYRDIARDDPDLVAVVEELGPKTVSGRHSRLAVVEIPADIAWRIEEYDGLEWIAEEHRTWLP